MLRSFKIGGIHPPGNKISKNSQITTAPLPDQVVVPLSQHIGAPATPCVAKGDQVKVGQLIGQSSGFVSANIHSPISGVVTAIDSLPDGSGIRKPAIVITREGDEWLETIDRSNTLIQSCSLSAQEIIDKIAAAGIVGMGGATFPAHVKFSIPEGKKVENLVINGVECEPYLTSDYRSMLERTDGTLEGIAILQRLLSPTRTVIGIEANKLDAAAKLDGRAKELGIQVDVQPLKMKYPQGDEKQLLKATTGREVPSGKLPIDIGAVVCNIGTVYAIWEAVVFHKPLIERIVTVSGEAVGRPCNVLAPIGTSTRELLERAGGLAEDADKLVSGGPMMGFAFADEDVPVTKGTSGVLALKAEPLDEGVCVSCGKCVAHCPMGLMPNRMFRNIKNGRYQEALDLGLLDCKECGCCAFICPAHLPLVQGFRLGKKMGRRK